MSRLNRKRVLGLATVIIIAIIATVTWEATARKKSKPAPRADRRFDHAAHDKMYRAKEGKNQACADKCHTVDAEGKFTDTGRNGHKRCDSCHSFPIRAFRSCRGNTRKLGNVCLACHQNFKCFEGTKPDFANLPKTFVATYSHKKHIQPGASTGRQCEGCHGQFGDAPPRRQGALAGGHQFCSGCHERGVEPLMKDCASCHAGKNTEAGKVPVALPRNTTQYATTGRFDHTRHAREKRVGTKGRDCLACHANIAKSKSDKVIPMPSMKGCYDSCHNGREAFSATGAMCTRCHNGGKR